MKSYNRGYAQIDLDAIAHNIEVLKDNINSDTQIMLVVKADAYSHGARMMAKSFEDLEYVWGFGVACLDEALELRHSGIIKPILILGGVFPDQYKALIAHNISLNVYSEHMAIDLIRFARQQKRQIHMHIKFDTGMSRHGFECNQESIDSIKRIQAEKEVVLEGVFTHFACADELDKSFTNLQHEKFVDMIEQLALSGVIFPYNHCANSATTIDLPEYGMNMVRVGLAMYGLYPSTEVSQESVHLKPALSLHSMVASVKELRDGMSVSYGGTYVAQGNRRIATIPIGYADGYPRSLSNQGYVLIHGIKAPIIGKICMDQFMVDVTDIPQAQYMSPVVLIGDDGEESLPVEVLGDLANKFNYEFICGIGKRIPRNYKKNNEIIEQIDYFA